MDKRQTVKYNRKIKREALKETQKVKEAFIKLIGGIPQQVLDYTDSGLDVTMTVKISSKKLLELLRS